MRGGGSAVHLRGRRAARGRRGVAATLATAARLAAAALAGDDETAATPTSAPPRSNFAPPSSRTRAPRDVSSPNSPRPRARRRAGCRVGVAAVWSRRVALFSGVSPATDGSRARRQIRRVVVFAPRRIVAAAHAGVPPGSRARGQGVPPEALLAQLRFPCRWRRFPRWPRATPKRRRRRQGSRRALAETRGETPRRCRRASWRRSSD